jgi:hypothetical protein
LRIFGVIRAFAKMNVEAQSLGRGVGGLNLKEDQARGKRRRKEGRQRERQRVR